jgi:seryl-tRNA synthetase
VEKKDCLSHHEVLTRLDGYDSERGVKIAGHRGYCLTGYGLFLNLAMVNYGLEFLFNKGYKPNQPPYFMLREYMAKTAQLEQFDEELYKVVEGENSADKYLIATSEQPISAMHDSEWMQEKDLPIKLGGLVSQSQRGIADTLSGTLATARAFEKRRVRMVKTPGESSASTNSKR